VGLTCSEASPKVCMESERYMRDLSPQLRVIVSQHVRLKDPLVSRRDGKKKMKRKSVSSFSKTQREYLAANKHETGHREKEERRGGKGHGR